MSVNVMGWVWKHSRSHNGARLVLLAIADCASDDGTEAWPSMKTIARKANLSERAAQAGIKELVALGELRVELNAGRKGTNVYTVLMATPADSAPPQYLHPEESAGVEIGTEAGATLQDPPQILHPADSAPPQNSTGTPADSAPEPSLNHPSSSSSKKSSSSTRKPKPKPEEHPRFAEFWAAYPLRVGKGDGRTAFQNAIDAGADPQVLIDAAARYARHHVRIKTERKWLSHPSSWLNRERWEDELGDEPGANDALPAPPHCGQCDLPDRTIELHDGSLVRCPECHPDAERNRQ